MRFIIGLAFLITGLSFNSLSAQKSVFSNHTISFNSMHSVYSNSFDKSGISFGLEYKNTLFKNFGLVASMDKRYITLESRGELMICEPACFDRQLFQPRDRSSQSYSADLGINYNLSIWNRHSIILSTGYHHNNIKAESFSEEPLDANLHGTFLGFEYAFDVSPLFAIGLKGKFQFASTEIFDENIESNIRHIGTSFTYKF